MTLGGQKPLERTVENVSLQISSLDPSMEYVDIMCSTLPSVGASCTAVPVEPASVWKHLQHIEFADIYPRGSMMCDILIGLDNYWSLVNGHVIRGSCREPVAMETKVGWVLSGPASSHSTEPTTAAHATVTNADLNNLLSQFWAMDVLGVKSDESSELSTNDMRVMTEFTNNLIYNGTSYTTRLVYKINHPPLPNNYYTALARLKGVERSLKRDPLKAEAYCKAMDEYYKLGFSELVTPVSSNATDRKNDDFSPSIAKSNACTRLSTSGHAAAIGHDQLAVAPHLAAVTIVCKAAASADGQQIRTMSGPTSNAAATDESDNIRTLDKDVRALDTGSKQYFREQRINYLPHHAVYKLDRSTTKCRIVFDGASKTNGVSINDIVEIGPCLLPDLLHVIIRFRSNKFALMGDVSKMFLRVGMHQTDRDVHRYLWRNLNENIAPKEYRMTCVTFGINQSPFSANATVKTHVKPYIKHSRAAREIHENMYVDDELTGGDNVQEVIELRRDIQGLCAQANLPLLKWVSNSPEVMMSVDESLRGIGGIVSLGEEEEILDTSAVQSKALGVKWNTYTDMLVFTSQDLLDAPIETKRQICSLVPKIFDPLGLLSPFVIRAKVMMQQLWLLKLDWDDQLPTELVEKWCFWRQEIEHLPLFTIPRWFGGLHGQACEIHCFGDASTTAYAACIYIRYIDNNDASLFVSTLVMAKSRVAPLDKQSLPKLELMGTLLSATLGTYVCKALGLERSAIHCWTDSQVVHAWLQRPAPTWRVFVANRVSQLHVLVDPAQVYHVPGVINPSDMATRGRTMYDLSTCQFWAQGPRFLQRSRYFWPTSKDYILDVFDECHDSKIVTVEPKGQYLSHAKQLILEQAIPVTCCTVSTKTTKTCIPLDKWEKWLFLCRVIAFVMKYIRLILQKSSSYKQKATAFHTTVGMSGLGEYLNHADHTNAEHFIFRAQQRLYFADEIKLLLSGALILDSPPGLKNLLPRYDFEIHLMVVGGRLNFADLPETTKHPIILPANDQIIAKYVQYMHASRGHVGPEQTLAAIHNKCWLLKGRREVRRVLYSEQTACRICRKSRVVAHQQRMGQLPKVRVTPTAAFTHVGVDFAGPIKIRPLSSRLKIADTHDNTVKCWIVVFTCMSSRAVHLDVVLDMSADTFLQAFRRMINRRGVCLSLWSDNAKTFKRSEKDLAAAYKSIPNSQVVDSLSHQGIEWHFIAEKAPWWGGAWERMVSLVKTSLKLQIGNAMLDYFDLYTFLTQVEAQINSRPLTTCSGTIDDPLPITPAHLAIGRSLLELPDLPINRAPTGFDARIRHRNKMIAGFWKRWSQGYLSTLLAYSKWIDSGRKIILNDIVLINDHERHKQRCLWPIARVIELHPGRDGHVRKVTLRLPRNSKGQRVELVRPVQNLHLLEADHVQNTEQNTVRACVAEGAF